MSRLKAMGLLYIIALGIFLSIWTQAVGTYGGGEENLKRLVGEISLSGNWETLTISPNLTYPYYHLDGGAVYYTPGAPPLPYIPLELKVPGEIKEVKVRYCGVHRERLPAGALTPLPHPTNHFLRPRLGGLEVGKAYPEVNYRVNSLGYSWEPEGRYHVYSIALFPVRYNLESGMMVRYTAIRYEVLYSPGVPPPPLAPATRSPTDVIHPVVPLNSAPLKYIIITSDELADEMTTLAQWRTTLGFPAAVVKVSDIKSLYPSSSPPLAVKNFLIWAKGEYPTLRYVLLAGDWDKVPVMRVKDSDPYAGWDDGYIPSDTFYACLDSDWDENDNGVYGEMGDLGDIIPDLVVSRLAINSESVWRLKIDQIKGYEMDPVVTTDWGRKALLVGANTHNSGDGEKQSEYLWNKYLSDVYEQKVPLYEGKGLSRSAITANIEQGVVMINFVDHGGPTVWSDNYGAGICYTDGDASSRRNLHMEPVVSTLACLTCWFDDPSGCQAQNFQDCIGEAFTENVNGGAIGYVGSSRTSVGVLGTNQYIPYDSGLQEDFARALTMKDIQGEVFTEAKRHYAASWGNLFNNPRDPEVTDTWLEYNFLGEPLITLWKQMPKTMVVSVNHTDSLNPVLQVWVKDGVTSQPVAGAVVTVEWASEGVWAQSTTDSEGYANLHFSIPNFGDLNLTVRSPGYIPYSSFITIKDTLPPTTTLRLKNATLGENGWYLSQPWINLTTDEPARTFFRWDGGEDTPYEGDVVVPEGVHSFYYYSVDLYGNVEREHQEILKVDLHDPLVDFSLNPSSPDGNDGWYISNVVVTLSVNGTVPHASPETVFYRLDGGPIKRYVSSITLGDGEHTLEYWAEEESGRVSQHFSLVVPVDTVAPTTHINVDPAIPDGENGYYVSAPTITLSSAEAERTYYRTSPEENFTEYRGPVVLSDGHHIFQYYSVDAAGNVEKVREKEILVDTRPPTIDVSIDPKRPDGKSGWYVTKPTIRFSVKDMSPTTIYYRIDRGPIRRAKGPVVIDDGDHTIAVYAKDEAGNRADLPTIRIKVDTKPPEVFCTVRGVNNNGVYSRIYAIELYTENSEDTIYYRWEGGIELEYTGGIKPPGDEGVYTLYYWSEDPAGNRCPVSSRVIQYDSDPPRGKVEVRGEKGRVTVDLSGITDGMEVKEYEVDFGDGTTLKVSGDRKSLSHTYSNTGDYTIVVRAYDGAGNMAEFTERYSVGVLDLYLPYILFTLLASVAIMSVAIFVIWRRGRSEPLPAPAVVLQPPPHTGPTPLIKRDSTAEAPTPLTPPPPPQPPPGG